MNRKYPLIKSISVSTDVDISIEEFNTDELTDELNRRFRKKPSPKDLIEHFRQLLQLKQWANSDEIKKEIDDLFTMV